MARQTFQLHRQIEQPLHIRLLIFLCQLGDTVERALQIPGIGGMIGDQFGQAVYLPIGHLQHPADIAQHRARFQFSEGDDLGDLAGAVFFLDITDHLAAAGFAEVDVEIRHRHTFGVEEPLEQQAELDRIEIGDGQRPGDDRARARTTARSDRNVMVFRPFDKIGNDQEIAREAHADDHVQLECQPIEIDFPLVLVRDVEQRQPPFQPGRGIPAQLLDFARQITGEAGQDRIPLGW